MNKIVMTKEKVIGCDGCRHINNDGKDYCYMFREQPNVIPCAQHDKFKNDRKLTGRLVTEHPEILAMMIASISGK